MSLPVSRLVCCSTSSEASWWEMRLMACFASRLISGGFTFHQASAESSKVECEYAVVNSLVNPQGACRFSFCSSMSRWQAILEQFSSEYCEWSWIFMVLLYFVLWLVKNKTYATSQLSKCKTRTNSISVTRGFPRFKQVTCFLLEVLNG